MDQRVQPTPKVARIEADSGDVAQFCVYTQTSKYKVTLSTMEKLEAENELQKSRDGAATATVINHFETYLRTRDYQRSFIGNDGFEIKHHREKFDWLVSPIFIIMYAYTELYYYISMYYSV